MLKLVHHFHAFTKQAWGENECAVLQLARQGYLYLKTLGSSFMEKAGVDKYGLQKWECLRGTNT